MPDVLITTGVDQSGFNTGMAVLRTEVARSQVEITRGLAQAITAGGLATTFDKIIEKASKIHDQAARFGVSAQFLQVFANAASEDGVALEGVAGAMNKLAIAQQKARDGSDKMLNAFAAIGVSVGQINTLAPDQLMLRIADGTRNAADRTAAYAAVAALLGARMGTELIPTLEKGSQAILQVGNSMGVFSDASLEALDNIGDQTTKVKNALTVNLGGALVNLIAGWKTGWYAIGAIIAAARDIVVGEIKIINRALHFDFSGALDAAKEAKGNIIEEFRSVSDYEKEAFGGKDEPLKHHIEEITKRLDYLAAHPTEVKVGVSVTGENEVELLKRKLDELQKQASSRPATAHIGFEAYEASPGKPSTSSGSPAVSSALREEKKELDEIDKIKQRIAELDAKHLAGAAFTANLAPEERLNALYTEREELLAKANTLWDDAKGVAENNLKLAENQNAMDQEAARLAKEKSDAIAKNLDLAQKEQDSAAQSLADSREAAKEDQLRLQGREDLAEQAKTAYDFDQKIAEAQQSAADAAEEAKNAKTEGEREAFQAVVATNGALAQQLGLEKNVALAALQKAQAERDAAEAAKVGAAAQQAAEDLDIVKEKTSALEEQRSEQEQIAAGHADIAAQMHDEFETAQQIEAIQEDITTATDEANDAWDNAAKAWSEGKNALAEQYTQLAKNKSLIADELTLQKHLTAETRATAAAEKEAAANAKVWAEGMQRFADNAQGLLQNVNNFLHSPEGQAFAKQYGPGAQQLLVNPNVPAVQQAMVEAGGGAIDPQRLNQLMAQQALIALQGGDISRLVNQQALNNMVAAQVEAAMRNMPGRNSEQIQQLQQIADGLMVYSSKLGQYVNPQQLADVERRGSLAQTPPNERGLFLALQEANKRDAIAALEAKIAAAQQAAAAASAAGNVAEEQKQITLQAQLQTQLDQARTGLSASQQAQRAQDTINERKAIELDYQNKINAATTAHNDALVAQLTAEEKIALAVFDKAHPPGTEGGASPADLSAVEAVQKSIEASKEAVAELQAKAAGASDDAISKMRTRFDFEKRIAEVQKVATEARAAGNSALADANDALAKQLAAEEQITLQQQNQLQLNKLISDSQPTYEEDDLRNLLSRLNAVRLAHTAAAASASFNIPPPAPAPSAAAGPQISQLVTLMGDVILSLRDMGRGIESIRRNTYVLPGT